MTVSFQNGSFLGGTSTASAYTTSGKITAASLYDTSYLDRKYEYNETKESYETKDTAQDEAIAQGISNILYLLENGYEDKAMNAYNSLIETISSQSQYSTLADSELQAVAKALIEDQLEEETDGEYTSLSEYITDKAASADELYMQKVWYVDDKCDETTEEDLLYAMCGIEADNTVSAGTKVKGFFANLFTLGGITEAWDSLFGSKHH